MSEHGGKNLGQTRSGFWYTAYRMDIDLSYERFIMLWTVLINIKFWVTATSYNFISLTVKIKIDSYLTTWDKKTDKGG